MQSSRSPAGVRAVSRPTVSPMQSPVKLPHPSLRLFQQDLPLFKSSESTPPPPPAYFSTPGHPLKTKPLLFEQCSVNPAFVVQSDYYPFPPVKSVAGGAQLYPPSAVSDLKSRFFTGTRSEVDRSFNVRKVEIYPGAVGGMINEVPKFTSPPVSTSSSFSSSSSSPTSVKKSSVAAVSGLIRNEQPLSVDIAKASSYDYSNNSSVVPSPTSSSLPPQNIKHSLYKTEFCRSFEESRFCRYGSKCQFAHSLQELRPVQRHPKYKTEICKTFWDKGQCPYGRRCCFIHREATAETRVSPASISVSVSGSNGGNIQLNKLSLSGSSAYPSLPSPSMPPSLSTTRGNSPTGFNRTFLGTSTVLPTVPGVCSDYPRSYNSRLVVKKDLDDYDSAGSASSGGPPSPILTNAIADFKPRMLYQFEEIEPALFFPARLSAAPPPQWAMKTSLRGVEEVQERRLPVFLHLCQ